MASFEKKTKMAFKAMDADGSGFLEVAELEAALKSMGTFTESETQALVKKMLEDDTDGDGKISFEEFLKGVMRGREKDSKKK